MTHYTSYNHAVGEFLQRSCWTETATKEKSAIKGDEHYADDFKAMQNIWGVLSKRHAGLSSTITSHTKRSECAISLWCWVQHLSSSSIFTPSHMKLIWNNILHLHNHWFESPTPCHGEEKGVYLCFYINQREANNALGPKRPLAVFHQWGPNW